MRSAGPPQIRSAATIGGAVASRLSYSDILPALCSLGAELIFYRLDGSEASQGIHSFLLNPPGEKVLIKAVKVPKTSKNSFGFHVKSTSMTRKGYIKVVVSSSFRVSGGVVLSAAIFIGGLNKAPYRVFSTEGIIVGSSVRSLNPEKVSNYLFSELDIAGFPSQSKYMAFYLLKRVITELKRRSYEEGC